MSNDASQGKKQTSQPGLEWPVTREKVGTALALQAALICVLAVVAAALLHRLGSVPFATGMLITVSALFLLAALTDSFIAKGITSLTQRLQRMAASLQAQAHRSQLTIALTSEEHDALGALVSEVNNLLLAYQNALADLATRADRLTVMNVIAATINRTFDLDDVFDVVLREALHTTGWDLGAIYTCDNSYGTLHLAHTIGIPGRAPGPARRSSPGEELAVQAAKTRQIIVTEDVRVRLASPDTPIEGPITQVSVPLVAVSGTLLGVLQAGCSQKVALAEDTINLLATVAHQLTLAIDKAQLYEQVRRHAEELEVVVRKRTEELAQAIEELQIALEKAKEADKVKSLLLSTVSHELRTPLATIKGNTSLLREHHQRMTPAILAEHLQDIEEETDKLTDLISNLLEMSRIEAGVLHIQREAIDLKDVLVSTVQAARLRYTDHDLILNIPSRLPIAYADPRRVEQIVANLIDNAAKYSDSGTGIRIEAEARRHDLVISVIDSGSGIAEVYLERIFDRFYQVHGQTAERSGDSQRRGIGLGLAICRGLVEAHEGQIWVKSEVGKGSTFSFSLPVAMPDGTLNRRSP
jgi:K+-sensing histidine kinase KdpD